MTDLSQNPDRDELREHFDQSGAAPTDCWENYGDVNPAPHGGDWITYRPDSGTFEMRGTFPAIEMGFDIPGEEELQHQYVYYNECRFGDIVAEDGSFTDAAQSTANTLHGANDSPVGLITDGRFVWFVVAYLDERRHAYSQRHNDSVYEGEYAEILESVGVTPCPDEL